MTSPSTDPARIAARELLRAVREDDAYANVVMPRITSSLSARDAAFAMELGYGTLRWQGFVDEVLSRCTDRPSIDPDLRDLLRLGAYQILFMRVPDHAAVDSTCNLVEGSHAVGRRGFVNAVLRRVAGHDLDTWRHLLTTSNTTQDLAIQYSHPEWIVRALAESLTSHGRDAAEISNLLEADNTPVRPALMARTVPVAELISNSHVEPGRWSSRAAILTQGFPGQLTAIADRSAIVQDEGSQLVALALAAVPVDPPETAWLDMCAGPGGKAALLEQCAQERGVRLSVVELHPHRAELMSHVLSESTVIHVGDARQRPWGSMFFDRVLVDAPCTGLGALRRRPEARWRKKESDVAELVRLQDSLLDVAIDAARTGGVVGYVTCSPHLSETVDVVEEVCARRDDVELLDAREYFPSAMQLPNEKWVQLWPHIHGTDAMFFAALRRVTPS